MSFEELGLNAELTAKLAAAGIDNPTEVQRHTIPLMISGKDGVIVSPTGTGKTLAYLLPILQKIDGARKETQAVILAPTQELAMQIMREAEAYGQPLGIKAVALIGGASLARQLERMKTKPSLIVGTPGRVREVASGRKLSLHAVVSVVVDETDRVFSLGGKADVENLMRQCSKERQTVFVSATRSAAMKEAETKWQKEPWIADVTGSEGAHGLSPTLKHWYFLSDRRDKIDLIRRLVRNMKPTSALVFVNDTEKIGELLSKLRYEGFSVDALYGDTPGRERGEIMQRFRKGRTALLIATDVAARGLDIPSLSLVMQYEPALDADHYVHRAGRTGRMGREGTSITLITPQERFIVDKLEKTLNVTVLPKVLYEGKIVSPDDARGGRATVAKAFKQADAPAPKKATVDATRVSAAKPGAKAAAAKPAAKPDAKAAAKPAAAKPAAVKPTAKPPAKDRKRDSKNKGAPKWLKEKRESAKGEQQT